MNRTSFERIVSDVLNALPNDLRRHITNVAIVVEDWPDEETLELADVDDPAELLGFYHGIPLTERTHDYGLVPPDKISIFQQPILRQCRTEAEARATIQRTVRHELAHYFGIDDDRLEEIGAY